VPPIGTGPAVRFVTRPIRFALLEPGAAPFGHRIRKTGPGGRAGRRGPCRGVDPDGIADDERGGSAPEGEAGSNPECPPW
jgi:hypothetical protein